MAYFTRIDDSRFQASGHVGGAWDPAEQHIAPAMGLLAHVVERDRDARRTDGLVLARLSYDIYGTMPVGVVDTEVRMLRPGRSIELVEAVLCHGGRTTLSLRAWLMQRYDTREASGSPLSPIPGPEEMASWDPAAVWPGGFLSSLEVRRAQVAPGRAAYWIRPKECLVEGEPVGATPRAAGLFDLANGMTVRADPRAVAFPNVDLTAHLLDVPDDDWLGFDTAVAFGDGGLGITASTIHGARGPIGTVSQMLTVRPSASAQGAPGRSESRSAPVRRDAPVASPPSVRPFGPHLQ